MNYIHHMNNWFAKVQADERLYPSHISLYIALFQLWNANRFKNPLSVSRNELKSLSKIGSSNTYTKCIKDLHNWKYIEYKPSKNPIKGSEVNMFTFDKSSGDSSDTSTVRALRPYIKDNKQLKHINKHVNQNKNYDEPL